MPSIDDERRRVVGSVGLLALAGCLGESSTDEPSETGSPTTDPTDEPTPTDGPESPPSDTSTPPSQPAGWPRAFEGNVIVLDEADGELYAVVADEGATTSRLLALDTDGTVRWETGFDADEHGQGPNEPDEAGWEWSTWLTTESIYLAAGVRDEWWAVRAFARDDGTERWSFREERVLAVRDVTADSLVVTSEEIFVPEHTHDTPEEPLTSRVYLLDRADGDATEFGSAGGVRAATAVEGRPYVASTDELVAFGTDGVRWRRPLAGEGVGVWSDGDRLLAIASDGDRGRVAGFSTDGERQWEMRAPDAHSADTLFADGTLYVGGGSGVLAVRADGTVAWRDGRPGGWFIHDDATDRVYSRSGASADAATAYTAGGTHRWTFDPPSNNAWPMTATDDAVLVTAITGDQASEPFYTIYAVDPESGDGSALVGHDTIFSVESVGDTAYLAAGDEVHAYAPSPGE